MFACGFDYIIKHAGGLQPRVTQFRFHQLIPLFNTTHRRAREIEVTVYYSLNKTILLL